MNHVFNTYIYGLIAYLWQITPEGRYVKPCNKEIAFHISMTTPKYAINPYICTHSSL